MIPAVAASSRAASSSLASTSTAVTPAASQAPAWAAALRERFPCRDEPIDRLVEEVALHQNPADPVFVSGLPATGKTAVVRALLHAASLRHAYVSCVEAATPRALLSSVLHQLRGGKRMREDGYAAGVKCDSISDFLLALADACRAAANAARRRAPGARHGGADVESPPPCWVVIDHAERLADTELLATLLHMRAVCGLNIGLLLIASLAHGDGEFGGMGSADGGSLVQVDFPGYSMAQLAQIMEARHQRLTGGRDELVFRQFLRLFLPAFWRVSNNLLELQAAVDRLFPTYCAPLRQGQALQAQALYARIKGQVAAMVKDLEFRGGGGGTKATVAARAGEEEGGGGGAGEGTAAAAATLEVDRSRACSRGLSFELPFVSKYLLLAAYIASRNKPATDRQVFDPSYRGHQRANAQRMDRQARTGAAAAEAALDAKLRGPHAFPLERLLHIFFFLFAMHAQDEDEESDASRMCEDMLAGEVLMQVSSLVGLRQLVQGPGDQLEGASYRCNLTEPAAHAIAANLKVPLADYLRLA